MTCAERTIEHEAVQPDVRELYRVYARPRTSEMLHAIRLDVEYVRAEGDLLYYLEPGSGAEVPVIDMLGGFGATFFGHNHPELVAALQQKLAEKSPINAQASVRGQAAALAARLSALVGRATGRSYVTTFSNSGTEAVEAALKHAEMEAWAKRHHTLRTLRVNAARALEEAHEGTLALCASEDSLAAQVPSERTYACLSAYFDELVAAAEAALGEPVRTLAVQRAFHGKTLGSLQLTYNQAYREPWLRQGAAEFVPADDTLALQRAVDDGAFWLTLLELDELGHAVIVKRRFSRIAAIIAEPIQGEGGVRVLSGAYLASMRALADAHGFPLILDEIQSGMGRTGTFLASEAQGVRGDYYVLSKSLGGGLVKIGALLVDSTRYLHDFGYLHTSTFAEDDASSAVALTALELLERDGGALMKRCVSISAHLLGQLRELQAEYPDVIAEVLGRGLMVGVRLAAQTQAPSPLLRMLADQHLLGFVICGHLLHEARVRLAPTLSSHDTLRIEPSAYIGVDQIDRLIRALGTVCSLIRASDVAALCHYAMAKEGSDAPPRRLLCEDVVDIAPRVAPTAQRRVTFLAHFRDGRDLRLFDPRLRAFDDSACAAFLERSTPVLQPFALDAREVCSAAGDRVRLDVIILPFTAQQASHALRTGTTDRLLGLLHDAVEMAYAAGSSVVGCGAYTSILSDNCRSISHPELGVTSGNSLTVAAAVQALVRASDELPASRRVLGVVGATGNIGATLAQLAAGHVDEVVLIGRTGAARRLAKLAESIGKPVRIESELFALRHCNLILSASNAPFPLISAEHLSHEPIVVCDLAVPADVDPRVVRMRPNARVLRGGLLQLPDNQDLGLPALDLPHGNVYACLGEALLLGLSGMRSSYSCGPLSPQRVRFMSSLAAHHGFLANAKWLQEGVETDA